MAKATRLFALKPCSFGGKRFFIGNEIPSEYVADPSAQARLGTIAIVDVDSDVDTSAPVEIPAPALSIVVKTEDKEMILEPSDAGIQAVFDVLLGKASDAEPIINQMDDNDALILLHLADTRKTIKEAAELRAKEIEGEQ